jgi:hypothetical protein
VLNGSVTAGNATNTASNSIANVGSLDGRFAYGSTLTFSAGGQVQWTNTNTLTFLKNIQIQGSDTTNIPTLFWQTSDGIGNGSMFAFSRAHATNLWPAEQSQTNWSQLIWGLNVRPNGDGSDRDRINTNMGAIFFTIENEWKSPSVSTSPISEIHLSTIDRNGDLFRVWGINQ